jgi:Tfp pilus assembly protein PilZ
MTQERRTSERVVINEEFRAVSGHLAEYVSDLSRGGIFLHCTEVLPIGTEVELCFTILTDDLERIEGRGEVVRHGIETPGLGIRFLNLTAASQALVERLCPND